MTILLLSSCAGDPSTDRPIVLEAAQHVTFQGQGFTWKRTVPQQIPRIPPAAITKVQDNQVAIDVNAEAAYQTALGALSDADYAEKMRIVALINGNEYLADSPPPLGDIARIRANLDVHHGDSSGNIQKISTTQSALTANDTIVTRSALISDSRQPQNESIFPGTTQIWLVTQCAPPDGPSDYCAAYCSATLIGPHTAITAAHCFYDVPSQSWKGLIYGASGNYPSAPNHHIAEFSHYTLTMYSAFTSDHSTQSAWDFAALDFAGFPDNPAPASGYLGYWQNISLGPNSVVWSTGYPHASASCSWFQLCGMSGRVSGSGVYWVSTNIFTSQGQSGTSLYYDDPAHNYYSVGDLTVGNDSINYWRRLDSTMYALFHYADAVRFP